MSVLPKCDTCHYSHHHSPALHCELKQLAEHFEMRAKTIAIHNQRSHTANSQQRQNMTVMYNTWTSAAEYVQARIKQLEPTKDESL